MAKASDLIGKNVCRTKPVSKAGLLFDTLDYNYTEGMFRILNADEHNIILCDIDRQSNMSNPTMLGCQYCDDNWREINSFVDDAMIKFDGGGEIRFNEEDVLQHIR